MTCTTHHNACECREAYFAELEKKVEELTQERNQFERHAMVLQVEKANAVAAYEREREQLAAMTQERDDLKANVWYLKGVRDESLATCQAREKQLREMVRTIAVRIPINPD